MREMTYEQAYIKCLDIASKHLETAYKKKSYAKGNEAMAIYQEMGALMLRLPKKRKK